MLDDDSKDEGEKEEPTPSPPPAHADPESPSPALSPGRQRAQARRVAMLKELETAAKLQEQQQAEEDLPASDYPLTPPPPPRDTPPSPPQVSPQHPSAANCLAGAELMVKSSSELAMLPRRSSLDEEATNLSTPAARHPVSSSNMAPTPAEVDRQGVTTHGSVSSGYALRHRGISLTSPGRATSASLISFSRERGPGDDASIGQSSEEESVVGVCGTTITALANTATHVDRVEGSNVDEIIDNIRQRASRRRSAKECEDQPAPVETPPLAPHASQEPVPSAEDEFRRMWQSRKKHIFIFSSASRPIFTRYGDETEFVDFFGMMGLLVGFAEKATQSCVKLEEQAGSSSPQPQSMRYVYAGTRLYVFVTCGPLLFMAASATGESPTMLESQLLFVKSVLLSLLTNHVYEIFNQRPNYDLRNLLGGTESMMQGAIRIVNNSPAFGLCAVPVLPLRRLTRDRLTRTLRDRLFEHDSFPDNTVYAFLLYHLPPNSLSYGGVGTSNNTHLITYLSCAKSPVHPYDFCLLGNFLHSSLPPHSKFQELWAPFCFPYYNDEGYLYAYMTFLTNTVSLVLVSCTEEAFSSFKAVKDALVQDFGLPPRDASTSNAHDEPTTGQLTGLGSVPLYSVANVDSQDKRGTDASSDILHFLYKDRDLGQYTCSRFTAPFVNRKVQKGLLRAYLQARERALTCSGTKKTWIMSMKSYSVLARVGKGYELFVAYKPLTTKQAITHWATMLKKWVRAHSDELFVIPTPFTT